MGLYTLKFLEKKKFNGQNTTYMITVAHILKSTKIIEVGKKMCNTL